MIKAKKQKIINQGGNIGKNIEIKIKGSYVNNIYKNNKKLKNDMYAKNVCCPYPDCKKAPKDKESMKIHWNAKHKNSEFHYEWYNKNGCLNVKLVTRNIQVDPDVQMFLRDDEVKNPNQGKCCVKIRLEAGNMYAIIDDRECMCFCIVWFALY